MVTEREVRHALQRVIDPELGKSLVELGMIKDILVAGGQVKLTLALTTSRCPRKNQFIEEAGNAVRSIPGVDSVEVELTTLTREELERLFPRHPLLGIQRVKNFIAVASGKGGVGKTTVAINLALALSMRGLRVGLLDADVYGPSIPTMLDLHYQPEVEKEMLLPAEKFGLKIMSIGFMVDEEQAVIWRGPLVSRAIKDFLDRVMWGELDCLVVDLPPGTGDPSITIAQAIPNASILMVTTPQKVALADVKRAVSMFRKMRKDILGIVENMSFFRCEHSDERIEIFGKGGGEEMSRETGVPLLAELPIDMELRKGGDRGVPLMIDNHDSMTGRLFQEIADKVAVLEDKSAHR